jgi:hypothetical protein
MGPSNVGVIVKRCAWAQDGHCHDHSPGRVGVRYRGTSRKCRAWATSSVSASAARSRDLMSVPLSGSFRLASNQDVRR